MRNPLHRKRLRFMLTSISRGIKDSADRMDLHQVIGGGNLLKFINFKFINFHVYHISLKSNGHPELYL